MATLDRSSKRAFQGARTEDRRSYHEPKAYNAEARIVDYFRRRNLLIERFARTAEAGR